MNWSLVCVSDTHPKGGNDWDRLVRKHAGFFGIDAEGQIVDGVAHLDPLFSPFVPPPVAEFDAANARALVRSEQRATDPGAVAGRAAVRRHGGPAIRIKERGPPGRLGFGLGKRAGRGGAPPGRRRAARHPPARGPGPGHLAGRRRRGRRRRWSPGS